MIGRRQSKNLTARSPRARAVLEQLDVRCLLSVTVVPQSGGYSILTVNDQANTQASRIIVDIDTGTGDYRVTDNGVVTEEPKGTIDSINVSAPESANGNYIEIDAAFPNIRTLSNGINGGDFSDTILGSPGNDVIFGAYNLSATTGNDLIYGRGGDDNITGAAGNDTIFGGAGNDLVDGGAGNDEVHGGKGDDQVFGGPGADTLFGGAGNDSLFGKAGPDIAFGGGGDDAMFGGKGPDTLMGGAGNNTLSGGKGRDVLAGNFENDLPVTGTTPQANTGLDSLAGGLGADTLLGGSGTDTLQGGPGADDFNSVAGDTLNDYTPASGDFQPSLQSVTGTPATTTTATLQVVVNGTSVPIPNGAGSTTTGTSVAQVTSVGANNVDTLTFSSATPNATFTLGQFFSQYGVAFGPNGIGTYAGAGNIVVTVNGVQNTDFQNYVIHSGDAIVITYTNAV